MHAIIVSLIVSILFLIITISIDQCLYACGGFTAGDLSLYEQYTITFFTVLLFSLTIECTGLNYLVCSGNH